jgi:hypothetical protein
MPKVGVPQILALEVNTREVHVLEYGSLAILIRVQP